jgi:hypothetical protein
MNYDRHKGIEYLAIAYFLNKVNQGLRLNDYQGLLFPNEDRQMASAEAGSFTLEILI